MSVIYGTGAFFGAINIKTNMVEEDVNPGMISASAGSDKTFRVFARSAGSEGNFQYSVNASYSDTDGINVPMADVDKSGSTALTTTKGLFENAAKYFNFSGKFKGVFLDAMYTESFKEMVILLPPVDTGTLTTNRSLRLAFGYDKAFTEKFRLYAKIGYFLNRMNFDIDFLAKDFYGVQLNGGSGFQAELALFFDPTPQLNILVGLDYRNVQDIRNDFSLPLLGLDNQFYNLARGSSMITQAIYGQLNWKITDSVKLVAGARVEQTPEYTIAKKEGISDPANPLFGFYTTTESTYSFTNAQIIPRLALIWSLNDKNYIKLLYGEALNRPSFFQITDTAFVPGIPALEPETIQTYEFNYLGTWSPNFTASVSVFHNILDKLIFRSLILVGGDLIGPYANVGKMQTTGVELTLNAKLFERFFLELSGTFQDTKDKRPGFEEIKPGYSPKLLGYLKASLAFNEDISLAVTGTYVDEMEAYYDDTLDVPGRLGTTVDAYFLLGANLRVRNLFGTKMFLNVRGSNLFDQEIRYPTTSNNSIYATDGTIGRGMSFLVTLGYKFIPSPRP
jgi:outer membrane receptor protein involved in Fe transport